MRMIDLRRLEHLIAVADCGHFARASQQLHLSQPALTRSIQALEAEIGALLLERHCSPIQPTVVGQQLIAEGRALLRGARQLREDARAWVEGTGGQLSFGMGPLVAGVFGGDALCRITEQFPGAAIALDIGDADRLIGRLRRLELEFAILSRGALPADTPLQLTSFRTIPLGLLVRAGHPLTDKAAVTAEDLRGYRLISGTSVGQPVSEDPLPGLRLLCDNYQLLREVACQSDAVWLTSPLMAHSDSSPALISLRVSGPLGFTDQTELVVVSLPERGRSALARSVLDLLEAEMPAAAP